MNLRVLILLLVAFTASQATAQSDRNYLTNQSELELVACNPNSDITNVREGPSASNYDKVAELLNGQSVFVLGRETNSLGFQYYRIVYFVQLGGGRLYEEEGYVYHAALAKNCNVNINEVVYRNTEWPVVQGTLGCKVALANEATLNAWNGVSASLTTDRGGVVNLQTPLCQRSTAEIVQVLGYLGQEVEEKRYHFEVSIDGCNMIYQVQKTSSGMEVGLYHTPSCPGEAEEPAESLMSGVDAVGNLFSFTMNMFVGGIDAISGGAISNAPPEAFIISKETAIASEIRNCEAYWTTTTVFQDIVGGTPSYSYCVIDYCAQTNDGSWFCSAEPVR